MDSTTHKFKNVSTVFAETGADAVYQVLGPDKKPSKFVIRRDGEKFVLGIPVMPEKPEMFHLQEPQEFSTFEGASRAALRRLMKDAVAKPAPSTDKGDF